MVVNVIQHGVNNFDPFNTSVVAEYSSIRIKQNFRRGVICRPTYHDAVHTFFDQFLGLAKAGNSAVQYNCQKRELILDFENERIVERRNCSVLFRA